MFLLSVLLASMVGIALGLLGGGGSILTVPILRYALGMPAHAAIATSLLVVGVTSVVALVPYATRGKVQFKVGLLFGSAGMVGAFLAGRVAHHVPPTLLLIAFAAMMAATAFAMIRGQAKPARATSELPRSRAPRWVWLKILAEGLLVGAVTGLIGAGGGFLVVPALVVLGGLPMDLAIGTSLVVISMKSIAGVIGFWGHTPVDFRLALPIAAAAVLGSILGGRWARHIEAAALRRMFGVFVIAMACFILFQELPPLLGVRPRILISIVAAAGLTSLFSLAMRLWERVRVETFVTPSKIVARPRSRPPGPQPR
ncbi:MAG TPA: sulfite exporter TauE/SafE family protein [Polyangiaceae bacterium]|nr:sulfite exporter TauE/SafE family protein [Polyangiaceae bacterium]